MPRIRTAFALAAASALFLTGCATTAAAPAGTTSSDTAPAGDAFPVTITHAFGTTTIESKPERVATVSWAN